MEGIFGAAGPGIAACDGATASLYDIAPTTLYLASLKIPEIDGKILTDALVASRRPMIEAMDLPLAGAGADASPYSAEDEALIEESLRNLGYL
jgi:hypothetical protein